MLTKVELKEKKKKKWLCPSINKQTKRIPSYLTLSRWDKGFILKFKHQCGFLTLFDGSFSANLLIMFWLSERGFQEQRAVNLRAAPQIFVSFQAQSQMLTHKFWVLIILLILSFPSK